MTTSIHPVEIHPDLDLPRLRELVVPDRPLWTAGELRELTTTVATELAAPLRGVLRFDAQQRWWTQLALTSGLELWLLSWLPGQGTRPHDHGGASGSFTVLLGELAENYRYPGRPIGDNHFGTGAALGFGPHRAHQVHNPGTVAAASVHAYSPPLLPVREYASLADVPAPE
jgi:hypothetical protein